MPDDLCAQAMVMDLHILASARKQLDRREKVAALDAYLAELDARPGPATEAERAAASAWADKVLGAAAEGRQSP